MPDSDQRTITFAPGTKPDPRRTFIRNPKELEIALGELAPGEPIVISHSPDETVDLTAYTRMLEKANEAGVDVVFRVETQ